ncbi:MAG: hypothetical protein ABSH56_00450 [Bryobacteraceae bacterium]
MLLYIQPSVATLLPVQAAICLVYSGRSALKKRLAQGLIAAAIVVAMLAPWTIRNRLTMGAWLFMRDNFGLELHVSNGDGAQPSQQVNQSIGWYDKVHPMYSAAATDEIRRVGEVNFNRKLLGESLSWIAAHPGRFRDLTLARIALFWTDVPSNRLAFLVRLLWSLFAWLGLFLMWRAGHRLPSLLLTSILAFYPLTYYLVQYSTRYVLVICFAIFLPAGFAVERCCAILWEHTKPSRPVSELTS